MLDSTYGLRLPAIYTEWMRVISWFYFIDWQALDIPTNCFVDMQQRYVIDAVAPLMLVAVVLLTSVLYHCVRAPHRAALTAARRSSVRVTTHRVDKPPSVLREAALDGLFAGLPFALVIFFFFAGSVSARIFRVRSCKRFGFDDAAVDAADLEHFFLREDLSIRCYVSEEHARLISLMWLFVAVWPVGVLILFVCVVQPCRDSILAGRATPLTRATHFLTNDYQPHVYFWEPLELARRTILTGWLLLLDESLRFIRLLLATCISIAFLSLLVSVKPYKRPVDDFIAITSQVVLVCIFICAMLIDLFKAFETRSSLADAQAAMGFDSDVQIVWVVILLSFGMLLLQLGALFFEAIRAWHLAQAAERWSCCTIHLPTCKWELRRDYCCFLSHYKMEAASDARYIRDALQKMLRCPVFIDSSSLADLRSLFTDGVHQSDCILLLVTKGVLTRPWYASRGTLLCERGT